MKTLEQLEAAAEKARKYMNLSGKDGGGVRVVVGLATCGMAAGAQEVLDALRDEVSRRALKHVHVVKTGCIGVCRLEPIVEVYMPGLSRVTYVKMTPGKAREIVAEHIVNGRPRTEYTIGANQ